MVIAESKPLAEILDMVKDFKKIVVAGCKGCVTVCCAGGEKEVAILASELRIARKAAGNELEVNEYTCERQCDPEYIEPLDDLVDGVDAVVSIACSVGPQYVAARYPYLRVFPGLNTTSIGGATEHGVWKEFCQACGNCIIGNFGGLVPHHPLRQAALERALRRLFRGHLRSGQGRHPLHLATDLRSHEKSRGAAQAHRGAAL